ncbi:MAG: HyaD/HybD family hydrogenase maturation endopeptidase [Dehalococcoidales bacterium]|nr:HyaD/HybD family hydrogenase maturation endopeptidase [Dehalococcoidales bacterium]
MIDSKRQNREALVQHLPILVMGVGNILMSDDGIGIHVIRAVQKLELPDDIELLDGGTASMSYLDNLSSREKVIIIDAVKGNNKPGTIYCFTPADISVRKNMITSLHQIGILESLTMSEFIGNPPQNVVIFGVEPAVIEWGMTLSSAVNAIIPELVEMICKELRIFTSSAH